MPWQDMIFAGGALVLAIALLPTIFGEHKPALATSVLTGSVLVVFSLAFASLGLWFSAVTNAAACSLWFILAVQTQRHKRQQQISPIKVATF